MIISRLARDAAIHGIEASSLNIVGTYNLACNASIMVEDGLGIAPCFDSIVNINNQSDLCLVPIIGMDTAVNPVIIWKKYQAMTHVARAYIEELQQME